MPSSLLVATTLSLILPPGTAAEPSAVCPLRLNSPAVAIWYDDAAIHVGEKTYDWSSLGVCPTNGATFRLPPEDVTVCLSTAAPRFRLGDFGVVGNRVVTNCVEIVPKADAVF